MSVVIGENFLPKTQENDFSLTNGFRLLSAYHTVAGEKLPGVLSDISDWLRAHAGVEE
jgi:hypothetical protein